MRLWCVAPLPAEAHRRTSRRLGIASSAVAFADGGYDVSSTTSWTMVPQRASSSPPGRRSATGRASSRRSFVRDADAAEELQIDTTSLDVRRAVDAVRNMSPAVRRTWHDRAMLANVWLCRWTVVGRRESARRSSSAPRRHGCASLEPLLEALGAATDSSRPSSAPTGTRRIQVAPRSPRSPGHGRPHRVARRSDRAPARLQRAWCDDSRSHRARAARARDGPRVRRRTRDGGRLV